MNHNPTNAGASGPGEPRRDPSPADSGSAASQSRVRPASGKLDAWVILDLLLPRWHWLVLGTVISAAAFYLLGWYVVKPKYTATAQLLRSEIPGKSEYFKTTPLSAETFSGIMRSPELLDKVGASLVPPVPHSTLVKWLKIDPEPDSDLVKVMVAARTPEYAVNLLNLYITNVVEFIRNQDARQAEMLANDYLKKQLAEMDADVKTLEQQFRQMPMSGLDTNRLGRIGGQISSMSTNLSGLPASLGSFSMQAQRLQVAMQELNDLLAKYTEAHPSVQAKETYIKELQKQLESAPTNSGGLISMALLPPAGRGEAANPEVDMLTIKMRALEDARVELSKRQREAELYAKNKPASVRVFAPAELKTVKANARGMKISAVTIVGGIAGMMGGFLLVLLVEFLDSRVKSADDLERVTRLPVLTTLGNLREMPPEDRVQWAFRAWTMLQGRLSPSANHGLICGITSANSGEGRSTWISLLAEAASLSGFRVLTIATRPSPSHIGPEDDITNEITQELGTVPANGSGHSNGNGSQSNALTTSVLASPAKITEELTGPNSQPVVHIPLPGWVWNLERRKQWRDALSHWRQVDNLVILVELPPAKVPEAVLLGSNLPNMVWLADSGASNAAEVKAHLETLRNARCNLVGAFLNRVSGVSLKYRFPRWVTTMGIFIALAVLNAVGQDATNAPASAPSTNAVEQSPEPAPGSFSITRPSQKASWQQHLTLGPGDVLTLNLYGAPELTRTEVAVGPDGRVSYLEAQDVMAAGATIDELRTRIDQELSKVRRAPRTMITPVAFKSKKYYMLGKVATKGVYVLDRPITVLEALARAHGFESAFVDRNMYDLTDLQHSFLSRGGKRIPVNFERLFQQGDLSQNIAVEPEDYIYIAPGDVNEVYVLGEVRLPGPVTYTADMTVVNAIAQRGGYTERAYKTKVLVVRGSLAQPEAIPVNTHAVLDAKAVDFRLKPRDVIYVNSRPLIRLEEAADLAVSAFIQSVVTEAVGVNVVKPIQ